MPRFGSERVATTTWMRAGRYRMKASIAPAVRGFSARWKSSSTRTTSGPSTGSSSNKLGSATVSISSGRARTAGNEVDPTRASVPASAAIRCDHKRTGSWSPLSRDTQATEPLSRVVTHSVNSVVLPKPAGAETRVSRHPPPRSRRSTSRGRAMTPLGRRPGASLLLINPVPGTGAAVSATSPCDWGIGSLPRHGRP